LPLAPILALLMLWQVSSGSGLIDRALFSAPTDVGSELVDLYVKGLPARSVLLTHVGVTLKRVLLAAAIGVLLGAMGGVVMGLSRLAYRFFDPLIAVTMPIPGIAMAPLFIVWLGFGDPTIITLGIVATLFPVLYNTAAGVRSIDPQLVRAAQIMGANKALVLFGIYLPWSASYLLTGIKLGLARCWRTVIAVEFIAATNWGLGYMIWNAAEYLRAGVVYGGIVLLIGIYFVMEKGFIQTIERNSVEKWGMVRK